MNTEQLNVSQHIRSLIRLALEEDSAHSDVTSLLTIDAGIVGTARVLARERLVLCGIPVVRALLVEYGGSVQCEELSSEGSYLSEGGEVMRLSGKVVELLALERTILNFLQRLSGVATLTRSVVERVGSLTILDTRKTTPGWRELEKYAVRCGGAQNHRSSLSDMILVKNNHIDANAGDVKLTLERVYRNKPAHLAVEVEVRTLEELRAALPFKPEVVMLDNMSDQLVRESMQIVAALPIRPRIEVSGGVAAERLALLESLRIDCVSMGSLTTKAPWSDLSMRIEQHE